MISELLTTPTPDGRALRISFVRTKDRYLHRVELLADGEPVALLESIESWPRLWELAPPGGLNSGPKTLEDWPPSPPLQQLSLEHPAQERPVALLLGMAGRSHWSMSVETSDELEAPALTFDVACRSSSQPVFLGSSYAWRAVQRSSEGPEAKAAITVVRPDTIDFRGLEGDGFQAPAVLRPTAAVIQLVPRPDASPPPTVRWKYRISCGGPDSRPSGGNEPV